LKGKKEPRLLFDIRVESPASLRTSWGGERRACFYRRGAFRFVCSRQCKVGKGKKKKKE